MKAVIKFILIIIGVQVVLMFTSCAPLPYFPKQQTIPLVKEKKELSSLTSVSMPNPLYSLYAVGSNFGVKSSLTYGLTDSYRVHGSAFTTLDPSDSRQEFSLGLGKQFALKRNTFLEAYIVGHRGRSNSKGEALFYNYNHGFNYSALGLQTQYLKENKQGGYFALSTSVKHFTFRSEKDRLFTKLFFVEPSLSFMSKGKGNVKYLFEFGTSTPILELDYMTTYLMLNLNFSVGINYCITCAGTK